MHVHARRDVPAQPPFSWPPNGRVLVAATCHGHLGALVLVGWLTKEMKGRAAQREAVARAQAATGAMLRCTAQGQA